MLARDTDEPHRVSTSLELLFDLTFVVAVAAAAAQLAHAIVENHVAEGLPGYLMVFFAIWWAWMNFTWFASAYDCDDTPYRLLTLLQMGGVLVLAAGVPAALNDKNFTAVTIGYVIMRVAMLMQWLRAARNDPAHRAAAHRYALGTAAVQIGWLVRLALPGTAGFVGFLVLVVAELAVPMWAERRSGTPWHPHHIAERYGLFTIIVLGESVLAASRALAPAVAAGVTRDTVLVGGGSLILLFACWWLYFLAPAGKGLAEHRERSFWWGYGHYGIFAGLAALGAGLEVVAETLIHPIAAPAGVAGFAVAVPVMVYLLLVWALHAPLEAAPNEKLGYVLAACVLLGGIGAATAVGFALPWAVVAMSVPVWAVVVLRVAADHRHARRGVGASA
ncbi:membrane protein [Pseudonocardia asaccharolytica DSM 44247 = NBRC 16224]|uniref:Membrane protein n=2 Tax=Pseudonocardia asaccharolytica TaxID=54010 RepID=A0A511CWR1_9PSEU|nr:membrane protein [Pseudonocardia asaccharolytica DSM 44247 = NBRC 16224]